MSTWLRTLSWNVRGLRDDQDAIVEIVTGARPHVVLLQEAPRIVRWRARAAELARRCGLVTVEAASGNLILVALGVNVRETAVVRLPLTRFQYPRAMVRMTASLAGQPFTAGGVHLGLTEAERLRHVPLLLEALSGNGPVILGGDINETSSGPAWQQLAAALTDIGAGDPTPTFSTGSPRRRIDGLFATPGLASRGYQVLDTPAVRRASDHFPISAEFELR